MASSAHSFFNTLNNKLDEPVRSHLKNVYGSLTASTLAAAAGTAVHMYTDLFRAGFLSAIGALVFFVLILATPDEEGKQQKKRFGFLLGFAFLTGLGMGPLLENVIYLDPSIVTTALIGTSLVFISFSLCALFAEQGKWLFLGGILMSTLNVMLVMSVGSIFFGTNAVLLQTHLYLGLFVMCGFVLYDTQLIIEKRRMGSKDFVSHSLDLFIDFIGIFKRLVILLTQKEEERKRRN